MIVEGNPALSAFAILIALVCFSCKQQPATPQPPASTMADNSAMSANTSANAASASNTNASSASDKGQIDACKLLTADEIKSVQGDTLKNTTPSQPAGGAFLTSQCFYATTNFVNSVSLTVTQQSPNPGAQNIREYWKETFEAKGREKEREKRDKTAKRGEEEEEGRPPDRVKGIGDEAYSIGNAKIGALYVLKGDKFMRISIGGSHDQTDRVKKMKILAEYAIKRL